MKKFLMIFFIISFYNKLFSLTAKEILKKVDDNLSFDNAVMTVRLEINLPYQPLITKRFKVWILGKQNSYVEFLNKEDQHIRYLKLNKKMWIYDKEEENTFLISGNLLKQSFMGSDMSYEDMLEADEIYSKYDADIIGEEKIYDRECYIILLTAKIKQINYFKRKMWIDKQYFVPLKELRYSKTDKLLKIFEYFDIKFYKDKVYPLKSIIKDNLKTNTQTTMFIEGINFEVEIPQYYFTLRYLER